MLDLAFDLRYLNYAFIVAETGSFRRAANNLEVSQSTLTRRIQLLERRLGVALFERTRTGARQTPLGERFLRNAAIGAQHLRAAVSEMTLVRRGEAGEVRIGLVSSLAQGVLGDMLEAYRLRYPSVDVKIEEASSLTHSANVLSGRLDMAFIPGEPRLSGCEVKRLWTEQLFVALPARHPLATREVVTWSELRDELFLVSADVHGPDVYGVIIRHVSELGFQPAVSTHKIGRENLINMVARGYGVTLVGSSTLGVTYPGVIFRGINSGTSEVGWNAIWSASNQNPLLSRVLDLTALIARGS
ncbi:LysR substrate-binding domain-containing protein [Rhizobium pisi]|uniref:LysR substrate-binding domain-containing protein n=1 Tax=Rhizobium pisi TaxID=574561 RepID=UPI003D06FD88